MEDSTIGLSVVKLSKSPNFVDIYEAIRRNKIVGSLLERDGRITILLSSGKLLRFNPANPRTKLIIENPWSQFFECEIVCAILTEDFPCVFYLENQTLMYLRSTGGDIHTAQGRELIMTIQKSPNTLSTLEFNLNQRIVLAISEQFIQVMAFNKKNELLSFAPFSPTSQSFTCENPVFFSKRYANLFYYVDKSKDPVTENIRFSQETNADYILKKCIIDNREISESRLHVVSFESNLTSLDINNQDHFAFITEENTLYLLKGNKTSGIKMDSLSNFVSLRWHACGYIIILVNQENCIHLIDCCLNKLKIISSSRELGYLPLNNDTLFSKIISINCEKDPIILSTPHNLAYCSFLHDKISLVKIHLNSQNFNEAVQCLETLSNEKEFEEGFFSLCEYTMNHIDIEYVKILEDIWTKSCHTKLVDSISRDIMIRLGYQLLSIGNYEQAFLLGRKLRSIRLLNDISYLADSKGFKGIATLAKYEREMMDEEYISPKQEIEDIIKKTGRVMNSADYALLLNDYEEILNLNNINDALGKGGYLDEKNFWEINLDEYAKAMFFEGEGRFEEALQIYTNNSLTHEINRVKLIVENLRKAPIGNEATIVMEEVKDP